MIETSDLVERSFLINTLGDNQHLRLKIVKALDTHQDDLNDGPALKEFLVTYKDDTTEEIMRHNEILCYIQSQDDQDQIEWHFKRITSHGGPLPHNHPNYNGSLYNVMT